MEVVCFISMLSSYQLFGLKKLFLYNSENISSERWCVFVRCIHMYLFLCKYINVHSSSYVMRVNSTKHSIVVAGFLFCFVLLFTVRRAKFWKNCVSVEGFVQSLLF